MIPSHQDKRRVFTTPWFSISEITGEQGQNGYFTFDCSDSAVVLTRTEDRQFVLVRQYRAPQGRHTLELPSGYVDPDESPQTAGLRELYEETGYQSAVCHPLGEFVIYPSRVSNRVFGFFCDQAHRAGPGEPEIDVVEVPGQQLERMMTTGEYSESTGMAMYFRCKSLGFIETP